MKECEGLTVAGSVRDWNVVELLDALGMSCGELSAAEWATLRQLADADGPRVALLAGLIRRSR